MNTQAAELKTTITQEAARRFASFAALLQMMCVANRLALPEESLRVTRPGVDDLTLPLEFTGRQPMGFAFTEGNRASFDVPFGHRFVIEQVSLSCWAQTGRLHAHLITKAPRYYRTVTLYCPPADAAPGLSCECAEGMPLVVNGSSHSTFLLSNEQVENFATVPPQTYLQVWGYLEPSQVAKVY